MKAIQVKKVTYAYPMAKDPTIRNVNLEIDYGEFVGLIGLTGAGKTTLFRLLSGLIPHYFGGKLDGDVFIGGMNTKDYEIGELASIIGMVFQDSDSQLFSQTVEDDVAFGPENLCLPREEIIRRVDEALEKAGLTELRLKSPNNLSDGEKQLVAIASILAMKPKILLLDEPTSNLDSKNSERVLSFIKELHGEGVTVLLATHEIDVVAGCANRIVLVDRGQILANGTPRAVFSRRELFQEVGLTPPQVTQLAQTLRDNGVDLGKVPITLEETFELIVRRLNG